MLDVAEGCRLAITLHRGSSAPESGCKRTNLHSWRLESLDQTNLRVLVSGDQFDTG